MASKIWTDQEMAILNSNPDKTYKELSQLLSGRSENAIRLKKESLSYKTVKAVCSKCRKHFDKTRRRQSYCPICEMKYAQERRIEKQVAKANKSLEEETNLIEKLHKEKHVCIECGEEKIGSEFHYLRKTKSLRRFCKACASIKSKQSRKKRISEGRDW